MLIVDFEATRARIKERCVAPTRVAKKYDLSAVSLNKFLAGKFFAQSGQGVCGRMEQALIDMDLLVYTAVEDLDQAA